MGISKKVSMKGCKTLKTRTFSKQDCLFDSKMIAAAAFVLFCCVEWREWLAGAGTQLLSKGSADFRDGSWQSLLLLIGLICREIGEYIGGDMMPVNGASFVRCCLDILPLRVLTK